MKVLKLLSISIVTIVVALFSTATSAFLQEVIPDWTNVKHPPFNLMEPPVITNPVLTAADVTDAPASFVADPFLFYDDGHWYMFFELLNKNSGRGDIGLATSTDGLDWNYQGVVLSEDWHLS